LLPSSVDLSSFHTEGSRNALRNILLSWPLEDVRGFFEKELSITLKVEPDGKVFPASDSSREVVDALLRECRRAGAVIAGGCRVERVSRIEGEGGPRFRVEPGPGGTVECDKLLLATGGLSLPRTGSDGTGYRLAGSLGHSLRATYPALVPLLASDPAWRDLAGISLRARLRAERDGRVLEEREGDFLFTHRGFSGPVVLDSSRHLTAPGGEKAQLLAAWLGSQAPDWDRLLTEPGKRAVVTVLREHIPRRLAEGLLLSSGIPEGRFTSELPRDERRLLIEALTRFRLPISGNEGYGAAEVTGGGIPLEEVSPRTLESRALPGLYLAGEILDVVGHIGGYNFLWAWVTGRKAGLAAAGG
jgi:hypothetical protein